MGNAERRPVPGFPFYEVDAEGNVWSLPRVVIRSNGRPYTVCGGRLQPAVHSGYPHVALHRGTECATVYVHQAVAEAFLGAPPPGHEVCHNDGNRANARLSNLRYGTRTENMADAVVHGTRARGERARHRLTEEQVAEIRRRGAAGEAYSSLAREFGVTDASIRNVCIGKTWDHAAGPRASASRRIGREIAAAIRTGRAEGRSAMALAKEHGLSRSHVYDILAGRYWQPPCEAASGDGMVVEASP